MGKVVFCETWHCLSRVHCRACRTDAGWRERSGAPDDCPHGVTADNLPASRQGVASTICPYLTRTCCGQPSVCGVTSAEVDAGDCAACRRRPDARA